MSISNLPGKLGDLPTFTYTKVANGRVTKHKAVSICNGNKDYTRRITQNYIDLKRWEDARKPKGWPVELTFPADILKAAMYTWQNDRSKKRSFTRDNPLRISSLSASCDQCISCGEVAKTVHDLCACTATPWDEHNTETWLQRNIELRWVGDGCGIGTYALQAMKRGAILGEYVGELIFDDHHESMYHFDVSNGAYKSLATIDALRVGNWTRFINHSCVPNASFDAVRVGQGMRYVVRATKAIKKGEQVTVGYGSEYWVKLNRRGRWCGCGADECEFTEDAFVKRRRAEREKAKKRRNR